ncbi:MAG: DUF2066 domain-containing protein [Alphaproteobacteria bacterium]|nr:DUF2066 domain-containing protein [Alphaproteobacteria bacterium]
MAEVRGRTGRTIRRAVSLALLAVVLGLGGARAADPYIAPDVLVDVATANPAMAREQAMARAPEVAARRLFDRLVLREHRQLVAAPDAATLAALVRGVELRDERVSPGRYSARIGVVFDRVRTRDFLNDHDAAFADTMSKPLLVVPVYETSGARLLWEADNAWRAQWQKAVAPGGVAVGGLVPMALPRADHGDMATIDAAEALAGNRERLRALAERYGVGEVMVVHAAYAMPSPGEVEIVLTAMRHGSAPGDDINRIIAAPEADIDILLAKAVETMVGEIEEAWRQTAWIASEQRDELTVRIPLEGVEYLALVRRRLAGVQAVSHQDLLSLTRREAVLRIRYSGEREPLRAALGEAQLQLEGAGDDWVLAIGGVPAGRESR